MAVTTLRGGAAPTPASIKRVILRGLVATYVVMLLALAGTVVHVTGRFGLSGSDLVPYVAAIAGPAVLVLAVMVVVSRRADRIARALEDDRRSLQHAYDRARLDAMQDGLTGLGNHRAFQDELDSQLAAAKATSAPLALLMIDVDDLKTTNDRRGHLAGDEVLRTVAQIMRANLRRGDHAFRIGGDEFALLLPGCDLDAAELVANHLLASAVNGNQGRSGPCSVTIGVAAFPVHSTDRHQLVLHADAALYSGKRHGRTSVQAFDPARHSVAEDPRPLAELGSAVERVTMGGLLRPVYQPIHSLETGKVIGFEGLVRLDPAAGFTDPSSLFIAAEATRRTTELDMVCARTVLAGAGRLGPDQYLAINLSPRTLEADAFHAAELIAIARRFDILPTQLVVEVTERESIEDLRRLQAAIASLRRHDIRVAIDDVGAGNAGLRLLSELDFDIMKIDLSLVRAGAQHGPSEAVLKALSAMARQRGCSTVAEGIETLEQLEAVLSLRIGAGQGYFLARPASELMMERVDLLALIASEASSVDADAAPPAEAVVAQAQPG
jgi:diguanylate cyclase (GGDEF)-like protein